MDAHRETNVAEETVCRRAQPGTQRALCHRHAFERSDGLLRSGNISTGCGNSAGETAVTVVAVREDVNELRSRVYSPPCITARRGSCVLRKKCETAENDAARGGFPFVFHWENNPASLNSGAWRAFF